MALNYAGLHLVAENFVNRPKSDQPYTNKLAETIHGASAYVIPHKVENRHRQQIEALCGSPQIQRIRTIMANSRATFGASNAEPAPPAAEALPATIPPIPRQAKSAAKQASRNLSVEQQEAKAQERVARRNAAEAEAVIAEARRLSTAKKAQLKVASKGSAKKVAFKAQTTPSAVRALAKDFDESESRPRAAAPRTGGGGGGGGGASAASVGGGGSAAAAAPPSPAPASAVTESRADSINATIAQVEGAAGRVKVVPSSREGKGAKGFQPAFIGDDGVIRGYKSADVSEDDLALMIAEFTKVRARLTDKKEKQDITNFITRIKAEKATR